METMDIIWVWSICSLSVWLQLISTIISTDNVLCMRANLDAKFEDEVLGELEQASYQWQSQESSLMTSSFLSHLGPTPWLDGTSTDLLMNILLLFTFNCSDTVGQG